ncbi:MAG: hypothetical protein A2Z83_05140 [Omnitrophica bacterium GWA2_52_8]|nr:MAG: hypothetical protein A2Z83_05140 [Omnitrophica bacterium GWA2_52_8]
MWAVWHFAPERSSGIPQLKDFHTKSRKPEGARVGPKMVFVIDDMGYTQQYDDLLKSLGNQVTYAVLPLLPFSRHFATLSQSMKTEAILHLPLESMNGTIPGRGLIVSDMPDGDVLRVLRKNLDSVPHISGVNNHMGSKGTADARLMGIILNELKNRDLFFLDSVTTPQTRAESIARSYGMPALHRDVFLDNLDSQEAVIQKINEMKQIARTKGYAIGIGHYRYNTFAAIKTSLPRLKAEGFQIVHLRNLIADSK